MRLSKSWNLAVVLLLVLGLSCSKKKEQQPEAKPLEQGMAQAAAALHVVSGYAWTPSEFYRAENRHTILAKLKELETSFHAIDEFSASEQREPGFAAILQSHQALLRQIREEFELGRKQQAGRTFRSLAGSCIACHSRSEAKYDFISKPAPIKELSIEDKLAAAEYLFATRQFETASERLFELGTLIARDDEFSSQPFSALKLWLLIEMRVRNRPDNAAVQLTDLITTYSIPDEFKPILAQWQGDLKQLAKSSPPSQPMLNQAQELIKAAQGKQDRIDGDMQLVKLLRATSIIHQLMRGNASEDELCQALSLLSRAYFDMPISITEAQRDAYFEQLFSDCPQTSEAKEILQLYKADLEHVFGTHMEKAPADASWRKRYEEFKTMLEKSDPESD